MTTTLLPPDPAHESLLAQGFSFVHQGKVRSLYGTPEGHLLVVASDRISAYDWVLSTPIPDKGRILTSLSLWWFDQLKDIVPHHVISTDVPDAVAGRAMVCQRLDMFPVECVARGYLTGSGLIEYNASSTVCGVELPSGLVDGSRLDEPIFTPATKADLGDHDENVDFAHVVTLIGQSDADELRRLTLAVYQRAEAIAAERGILLADTKFEFGRGADSTIVLGDEVLTPDSSRFWPAAGWKPGSVQPSYDKQFVRDWLTSAASGWDRTSETEPPALPQDIVAATRAKYLEAYELLTGQELS
ncbi:MAG: phosphoribosylaminoimidazole-succinocarboxamide synthase [actinobacterium acAMD-2]|nr:MAG: phosphoribosylaminoimidazole-succinocarboxamide synthase [actinobacterium acAMD-2]